MKKLKVNLIRKLRLRKGFKYFLFFPKSAGLSAEDLEKIDYKIVDLAFLVEDTRGIKVIEYDEKRNKDFCPTMPRLRYPKGKKGGTLRLATLRNLSKKAERIGKA